MTPDLKAAIAILAIVIFFIIMDQIGVVLNRMVKKYEEPFDWYSSKVNIIGYDEFHAHTVENMGVVSKRVAQQYNKFWQAATYRDDAERFAQIWRLAEDMMIDFQKGHATEAEMEVFYDALELQLDRKIKEKQHVS